MIERPPRLPRRDFLRAAATAAGGAALLADAAARAQTTRPPNVVIILCDDLGYGDLQCYGSNIPTPNIDAMALEGVRFDQFYSASAVCSPSRAALMTGRYPARVHVPEAFGAQDPGGLPLNETTIAEMLKPVGYKSMCVGKWHLGSSMPYLPTNRGFDEFWGMPYSNDQLPSVLLHNTDIIESPAVLNTLTQRYTQQATSFIQRSKNSPFFLYFAHTFPHIPLAASTAFAGSTKMGLYADVVSEIDWSVGQVLQSLKDNGVDSNTLTLFTSDNGPWYLGSPGKLRGRKGWTYEGGFREPFIARFPGRIPHLAQPAHPGGSASPPGPPSLSAVTAVNRQGMPRVNTAMANMMDIFPTIASLCNAKLPSNPLDGVNLWPVLNGRQESVVHDTFFYFDGWNLQCARFGAWKLHVARYNDYPWSPDPIGGRLNLPLSKPELYNLEVDPDESYEVGADNPGVVSEILARIAKALLTFPVQVQIAWVTTISMKAFGADGALPALIPQP